MIIGHLWGTISCMGSPFKKIRKKIARAGTTAQQKGNDLILLTAPTCFDSYFDVA